MPGTWKRRIEGVWAANKRYRQAIDTQLGRNRMHQKRSPDPDGKERDRVTWVDR